MGLGANDVVNPAAATTRRAARSTGMPILEAPPTKAQAPSSVNKRSMASRATPGLDNELFYMDKTMMVRRRQERGRDSGEGGTSRARRAPPAVAGLIRPWPRRRALPSRSAPFAIGRCARKSASRRPSRSGWTSWTLGSRMRPRRSCGSRRAARTRADSVHWPPQYTSPERPGWSRSLGRILLVGTGNAPRAARRAVVRSTSMVFGIGVHALRRARTPAAVQHDALVGRHRRGSLASAELGAAGEARAAQG